MKISRCYLKYLYKKAAKGSILKTGNTALIMRNAVVGPGRLPTLSMDFIPPSSQPDSLMLCKTRGGLICQAGPTVRAVTLVSQIEDRNRTSEYAQLRHRDVDYERSSGCLILRNALATGISGKKAMKMPNCPPVFHGKLLRFLVPMGPISIRVRCDLLRLIIWVDGLGTALGCFEWTWLMLASWC